MSRQFRAQSREAGQGDYISPIPRLTGPDARPSRSPGRVNGSMAEPKIAPGCPPGPRAAERRPSAPTCGPQGATLGGAVWGQRRRPAATHAEATIMASTAFTFFRMDRLGSGNFAAPPAIGLGTPCRSPIGRLGRGGILRQFRHTADLAHPFTRSHPRPQSALLRSQVLQSRSTALRAVSYD